ncbi:MAG TPA: MmgE/PrpD family protein [Solirubrobacteraceae bacterium]|jgi:2-methylcitrate dehydratase PrpD|nr:MmgE/PrpD family protein [Solirubrobacteraceae bacterium]
MTTTIAQRLGQFAVTQTHDRLPDEVGHSVRQRTLDTLGIMVAAGRLDTSRAIRAYATEQGGRPEAHAVGVAQPLPAELAALVNGTLAHSLDYDDTHLPSVLHPSASIVPACLAVAQAMDRDGRELTAAIAVGLEICVRLGMAGYDREARNNTYFDRGQHATSICGTIAGAASAAVLLGLDADGVTHAIGLAASMAGGVIEANRMGGTVKRIHCGWAAHAAISAARLAAHGITGPPTVLEGRFGFFQAFLGGHYDAAAIEAELGERWEVPGIFFKPYPANHFTHAGIDAALALREQGVSLDDVEALSLGVAEPTVRTIGEPIEVKRAPSTGYQAQFSGPYTVVAALLGGGGLGLGLDDFTDALATDETRRRHMAKVTVAGRSECDEVFPNQFPAVLTARLRDGRELERAVMNNRGGPQRPLSDDELQRKFTDNAGRLLGDGPLRQVQDTVLSLDRQPAIGPLLAPMTHLQEE